MLLKNKLKKCRVDAGLTQAKLASIAGVTQPTYQRWESGFSVVPEAKLGKLAEALGTTPDVILGNYAPIESVALYDPETPEHIQYYGEVAIHFRGGGEPLLLSISERFYAQLHGTLQGYNKFLVVRSLSNQTVAIRASSIAEVYFSSDAYDDYGPEGQVYLYNSPLRLPDSRDWEILEAIAHDVVDLYDFDPVQLKRIEDIISLSTDEELEKLANDGLIRRSEIETEKIKQRSIQQRIFDIATNVTYQLSTGERRSFHADSNAIYDGLWHIIEWPDAYENEIICIAAEGYHRTIFVNPDAVDYISLPTHQWEEGQLDAQADSLEDLDKEEALAPKKRISRIKRSRT